MSLGMRFIAIAIAARAPPIVARPRPISSQDIVAMSLRAPPRTTIAVARPIIPRLLRAASLGKRLTATTMAVRPPAAPARPLPSSSQLIEAIIFIPAARITSATASLPIALDALRTFFSGNRLTAATSAPRPTTVPVMPTPISLQLMVLMIFMATERIRSAVARPFMAAVPLIRPFEPEFILVNRANAVINSVNRIVIAPRAESNLALSTIEITTMDAARMAIATAIFLSASALSWF